MRLFFALLFVVVLLGFEANRALQWLDGVQLNLVEREIEEKKLDFKKLFSLDKNDCYEDSIPSDNNQANFSLAVFISQYYFEIPSPPPELS